MFIVQYQYKKTSTIVLINRVSFLFGLEGPITILGPNAGLDIESNGSYKEYGGLVYALM